jgi:type II secretory pathway component PulF
MYQKSHDRVEYFGQQLQRLLAAGVPLELELPGEAGDVAAKIDNIAAVLRLRTELGQPLEEAIQSAPELSPRYRASLISYLTSNDPQVALDPLVAEPRVERTVSDARIVAFIQPVLIALLTFFGMLIFCFVTLPAMEGVQSQLSTPPDRALTWMGKVRDAAPIWGVLIPVGLILLGVRCWFANPRGGSRILGRHGYQSSILRAEFADRVASLLEQGVSRDEALQLADPKLGSQVIEQPEAAPPLLRWAFMSDLGSEPLPVVLRFVSSSYRQIADDYAAYWRVILPAMLTGLVGGLIVFAYCLCFFVPYAELLQRVYSP